MGANVILLGVLTSGGIRPKSWDSVIKESIEMGMSIVNGLHDQINPEFSKYIIKDEQWIWDTRVPQFIPKIGSSKASELSNKRVLMIGTDMAAGKMTVGLELYSYLRNKKYKCWICCHWSSWNYSYRRWDSIRRLQVRSCLWCCRNCCY